MVLRDLYARYDEDAFRPRGAGPGAADTRAPIRADDARASLTSILWRRKLRIVATIALCVLGGLLYILVTPPRYLAATSMLIDPRLGKSIGADPVQPGFIVDTSAMDSQVKLFTSQTVLLRVAKMADLANDPEFNGSQRSLLSRLLHPGAELEDGADLKTLERAITIKRPERTYVVGIEVLARDPRKAADIANDLTQAYIEDQITARVDAAQDDTKFVRQQLTKLAGQIKEAEDKVEAFKTEHKVVDTNGLRSNEQQVTDLTKALGDARARLSDTKAKLDELRRMEREGRLDASSEALRSLTIERLRQQQAESEENVAKLATTLGARHPELVEARGRAAKVHALIRDELRRLALSAAADYQSALRNEQQIRDEVGQLKGQSTDISRDLVPLGQLERNVAVLRASFERFAQIRDNLTQQEADSPPGRVISVARPPVSPTEPKKTIVTIVSLAAGLFFGLAAALFAEGTGGTPGRRPLSSSLVYEAPGGRAGGAVKPVAPKTPTLRASRSAAADASSTRTVPLNSAPSASSASPSSTSPPGVRPRSPRRYWDDDDSA